MLAADYLKLAESVEEFAIAARRRFHMHPELSYQEEKTAAFVAGQLREMGYEPETEVGGLHGVTTLLKGGKPGPTIGFRADMDALPLTEMNDLPFKSQEPGVMHACGHDIHTATLLGAAKALRQIQPELAGNVRFLFQPAEEQGPGGAKAMVQAGALKGVDAVFMLHCGPTLNIGQFGFLEGYSSANSDGLKITITGKGGHAARPHMTVDPVLTAAHVIVALQQIVSRQVSPTESAVVTIGAVHGGTRGNIIPETVELMGTVRTLSKELRATMPGRIESVINGVCAAHGASGTLEYRFGYPSQYNEPVMVDFARKAAALVAGPENVVANEVGMGAEDFSYMLEQVPGSGGRLGVASPETPDDQRFALHSPRVILDERGIRYGIAYWIALADLAGQPGSPVLSLPQRVDR